MSSGAADRLRVEEAGNARTESGHLRTRADSVVSGLEAARGAGPRGRSKADVGGGGRAKQPTGGAAWRFRHRGTVWVVSLEVKFGGGLEEGGQSGRGPPREPPPPHR